MTSDEPVDPGQDVDVDQEEGGAESDAEEYPAGARWEPDAEPDAELAADEPAAGPVPEFGPPVGEPEESQELPERRDSPLRRYLVLGSAGLAAAALIVAAVFGIQWWVAASDDNVALAQAREDVVREGGIAVKAFIEVDYTNLDAYFQRQLDISDSTEQAVVKNTETTYRQALIDSKTRVTDTDVAEIGVEELDDHDGKASFLAAVSYVVNQQGQQPAAKLQRLEVQMTRIGQDWKVSVIGAVPTVTSGQ
jgi:Mce-associated membrane protein